MYIMRFVNKIRQAYFSDKMTRNAIAKKFKVSWDTVNRIVSTPRDELPNRGSRPSRQSRVKTPQVVEAIEVYLKEEVEMKVRRKQRYTPIFMYNELKKKGIYTGSLRRFQAIVKEIREKHKQTKIQPYLPLEFSPGSTIQLDHGEVDIIVAGNRVKGYLFASSVPGQVLRFCQVFPTKSMEAWGEHHERTFKFFDGIFPCVVYDNDSVLVKKVIGRDRKQTDFSQALEEHYGFCSHFCNVASGNEKGAVENAVGFCRRNYFAGCPSFKNWQEANEHLKKCCEDEINTGKHYKNKKSLKSLYEENRNNLKTLKLEKEWKKHFDSRVDSLQLVKIDNCNYSVPEKYVGMYLQIALSITEVKIYENNELIVIHKRKFGEDDSLILDHYLDQLKYKAFAFNDCKAVKHHKFDPVFLTIWDELIRKYPRKEANREFVEILLLGRRFSKNELLSAIEQALKYRSIKASSVESILTHNHLTRMMEDQNLLRTLLPNVKMEPIKFDVSIYSELCEVAI